jgi:hypothetical protein
MGWDHVNPVPGQFVVSRGIDEFNRNVTIALQRGGKLVGSTQVVSNGDKISYYQGIIFGSD